VNSVWNILEHFLKFDKNVLGRMSCDEWIFINVKMTNVEVKMEYEKFGILLCIRMGIYSTSYFNI